MKAKRTATPVEMAKEGRDHCKKMLKDVELLDWNPVDVYIDTTTEIYEVTKKRRALPAHVAKMFEGLDDGSIAEELRKAQWQTPFLIAKIDKQKLRRELSDENYATVCSILEELMAQAQVATYAVNVAKMELALDQARSSGGAERAKALRDEAKIRSAKIAKAAAGVKRSEPGIKKEALAVILADRGLGGKHALSRKLAKPKKV